MRWKLRVREPSIEDLLADEIMALVMRSAGINADELRALLRRAAGKRGRDTRRECSADPLCCAPA
jgi:hypothetical protein